MAQKEVVLARLNDRKIFGGGGGDSCKLYTFLKKLYVSS